MRTQQQSIAVHQCLRILGGSGSSGSRHDIAERIYGMSRIINWLLDDYPVDIDHIHNAALRLKTEESLREFRKIL